MSSFVTCPSPWLCSKTTFRTAISKRCKEDGLCLVRYDHVVSPNIFSLNQNTKSLKIKRLPAHHGKRTLRPFTRARNRLLDFVDMPGESQGKYTSEILWSESFQDATEAASFNEQSRPSAQRSNLAREGATSQPLIETGSNSCHGCDGQEMKFVRLPVYPAQSGHSTREKTSSISLKHNTITEMGIKNPHTPGIVEKANSERGARHRCSIINVNSGGLIDSGQVTESSTVVFTRSAQLSQPRDPVSIRVWFVQSSVPRSRAFSNSAPYHNGRADIAPDHDEGFLHQCSEREQKEWRMISDPLNEESDFENGTRDSSEPKREKPYEERLVVAETNFTDGRYGTCHKCGSPIVIPGLAQSYCAKCGWIRRPVDLKSVAPGHHD